MKPVVLMSVTLVTFPEASAGHRLYDCPENIVHASVPVTTLSSHGQAVGSLGSHGNGCSLS